MALVAQALLTVGLFVAFGPVATAVHLGSAVVMVTYTAILDYVLHYGLKRPQLPGSSKRYTPITPYTSWNSLYPLEVRLTTSSYIKDAVHRNSQQRGRAARSVVV